VIPFAIDAQAGTALVVIGGLAIFGLLLLASSWNQPGRRRTAKVPWGARPGPSDEELEHRVLLNYLVWSFFAALIIALWIPAYWLREPKRMAEKRTAIANAGIEEGKASFVSLCAQCHGPDAGGGIRQVLIRGVAHDYAVPPLKYAYSRYLQAGRRQDEITQLLSDTINHGRPGTPMPTWALAFGGPLNSHQVSNIVAYLQSIQEDFPKEPGTDGAQIFSSNCAVCHGTNGEGGVGPNLRVALQRMTPEDLKTTIRKGRVNVERPSMPSWAALGDGAVEALVRFIESIQEK